MATTQEGSWTDARGIELYTKTWNIESPQYAVGLVHGMGEHINRYDHVAAHINAHGGVVVGFDHQGHGQSGGPRGHAPDYASLLDGVDLLLVEIKKAYPGLPVFLYGHSMGGGVVLNYCLQRSGNGVCGVVATGPFLRLAFEPSAVRLALGKMMKGIAPGLTQPTGLKTTNLSRSAAVVTAYENDPLVHGKTSTAMALGLLEAGEQLARYQGDYPVPVLLMHGEADQITSAETTRHFAERVGGDVTYQGWPGLYHEIHNEPEQAEVLKRITDWIDEKK